jgi:hypothetical protein
MPSAVPSSWSGPWRAGSPAGLPWPACNLVSMTAWPDTVAGVSGTAGVLIRRVETALTVSIGSPGRLGV